MHGDCAVAGCRILRGYGKRYRCGTLAYMKRRAVLRSILSLPAISALPAAAQAPPPEKTPQSQQKLPPEMKPPGVEETPKLAMTNVEGALSPAPNFFSRDQYAALSRLCELLVPASESRPGAKEAAAPEFLDFLIERSPSERQELYRRGLDRLNAESRRRFGKSFADVAGTQASELLAPLEHAWTFEAPADDFARFLASAKEDVLRATVNSREWAAASTGRRAGRGMGTYWYSME